MEIVGYWVLSITALRRKTERKFPEWVWRHATNQSLSIIWDPGTFADDAINYPTYRRIAMDVILSNWPYHKLMQYDEVGDPEATIWYRHDLRRRGIPCLSVIQPGESNLDWMESEQEFFVGGLVPMTQQPDRLTAYLDGLFYPNGQRRAFGRVHLLGVGQEWVMQRYPATSSDNTSFIKRVFVDKSKRLDDLIPLYGERDIPYVPPQSVQGRLFA